MKEQRLLKAMGQVDEKYVEEASPAQHSKRPGWLKWGAIAACLCLVVVAAAIIPNTLTPAPDTGISTSTGIDLENGDQDMGMTTEELTSAMLDAGYTQAEVDEYQSIGYQMTWAKWWKFFQSIEDTSGNFTLDALKTFSQEELLINTPE